MRLSAGVLVLTLQCGGEAPARVTVAPVRLDAPKPPALIPNTEIEDSPENRRVLAFCERYRTAFESKDVEALVAMASPKYKDADMNYASLANFLRGTFGRIDAIRYDFLYRHVWFTGNQVSVEYTYMASYRIGKTWEHKTDDNRLVLEIEGDSFRILSGM